MQIETITPRRAVDNAFLQETITEAEFETFRQRLLNQNTDSGINGIKDGYRIYGLNNFKATTPHEIINLN